MNESGYAAVQIAWREGGESHEFWLRIGDWRVTDSIFLTVPEGETVELVAAVALVNLLGIRNAKVKSERPAHE